MVVVLSHLRVLDAPAPARMLLSESPPGRFWIGSLPLPVLKQAALHNKGSAKHSENAYYHRLCRYGGKLDGKNLNSADASAREKLLKVDNFPVVETPNDPFVLPESNARHHFSAKYGTAAFPDSF